MGLQSLTFPIWLLIQMCWLICIYKFIFSICKRWVNLMLPWLSQCIDRWGPGTAVLPPIHTPSGCTLPSLCMLSGLQTYMGLVKKLNSWQCPGTEQKAESWGHPCSTRKAPAGTDLDHLLMLISLNITIVPVDQAPPCVRCFRRNRALTKSLVSARKKPWKH